MPTTPTADPAPRSRTRRWLPALGLAVLLPFAAAVGITFYGDNVRLLFGNACVGLTPQPRAQPRPRGPLRAFGDPAGLPRCVPADRTLWQALRGERPSHRWQATPCADGSGQSWY